MSYLQSLKETSRLIEELKSANCASLLLRGPTTAQLARAIDKLASMKYLRQLTFDFADLEGLTESLARALHNKGALARISLVNCGISDESLEPLLSPLFHAPSLRQLDLRHNILSAEGAKRLTDLFSMKGPIRTSLEGNLFDCDILNPLADTAEAKLPRGRPFTEMVGHSASVLSR